MQQSKSFFKKHRWAYWSMQVALIVLVLVVVQAWQTRHVVSGYLPAFEAELINGEIIHSHDYKGEPLLIHFWATWCPICMLENDTLVSLAKDYPVITIASWSDAEEVSQLLDKENLEMPVIVDQHGLLAKRFNVKAVPTSFFMDKNGKITFVTSGYTTELGFRMRLNWLLI